MVSRLIKIGESFAVKLNRKILKQAGILPSREITISVKGQSIIITQTDNDIPVNLDRSTWDAQFKKAIKAGHKPEKSF